MANTIQKVVQSVQAFLGTARSPEGTVTWGSRPVNLAAVTKDNGNVYFAQHDAKSGKPIRGLSVRKDALPLGLDTPIKFGNQLVPMTEGKVIEKDRKTQVPTGSHRASRGELAVLVNGKPMIVKALISEPKDDRFYVSLAVVNATPKAALGTADALFS